MKSVGIICEYNPFHNGHLYHLNKVKEMFSNYTIILVLSPTFTERGEMSIMSKWDKTRLSLEMGINLVIELPFPFATQSADFFSRGSIEILNYLNCDYLVFGSESGDIDLLTSMADTQLNNTKYNELVKDYLASGFNYPTALSKSLMAITGINITTPNDILGVGYIREIMTLKSNIKPLAIKRTNEYHSKKLDSDIVSASAIREGFKNSTDIKKYLPTKSYSRLIDINEEEYFNILKYKLSIDINKLSSFQTVDEGIENRIKNNINKSLSLDELIKNIKTKRYTYNRIQRMLTHIICDFTKEEASKYQHIEYIRVLGFDTIGKKYLNSIKKDISIPIITNCKNKDIPMLNLEHRITTIYNQINKLNFDDKFEHPIVKED